MHFALVVEMSRAFFRRNERNCVGTYTSVTPAHVSKKKCHSYLYFHAPSFTLAKSSSKGIKVPF